MAKMPAFAGPNARFLPNTTFKDRMALSFGSDRVDLYYFGAGHTSGDAVVVFPGQRLAYFRSSRNSRNPVLGSVVVSRALTSQRPHRVPARCAQAANSR